MQCSDASLCRATSPVEVKPNEEYAYFEVTGLSPGYVNLEATVPALPDVYPDVGKASIKVVPPSLSIDSTGWDLAETAYVGDVRSYEICISAPAWGVRSYSLSDMNIQVEMSDVAVASVVAPVMWSARQECISVELQFLSLGTSLLTINVPGIPAHTKRFDVRPPA